VPELVSGEGFMLGLPLLVSICPLVADVAGERLIPFRLMPREHPDRPARADRSFQLVQFEADLWALARRFGGLSQTMPFATRVRALRWWWEPRPGRTPRPTICLRCGSIFFTRALRSRLSDPYCTACTKSRALTHPRAVAPGDRGEWWLRCSRKGCTVVFGARAQARKCPDCRRERITPKKRPSLYD